MTNKCLQIAFYLDNFLLSDLAANKHRISDYSIDSRVRSGCDNA